MLENIENKKKIKMGGIVMAVLSFIFIGAYAIQYYRQPVKKDIYISDKGILIYNTNPATYEIVDVEVKGKEFHYIFNNKDDGVYGNVWVNKIPLFGYEKDDSMNYFGGFYTEFYEKSFYSPISNVVDNKTPGNMFFTSKDKKNIICQVELTEDITPKLKKSTGNQSLLVMYAQDIDIANTIISKAISEEHFANWLIENDWTEYVE